MKYSSQTFSLLYYLWNNSNKSAWGSDYYNNINVEMNYWVAKESFTGLCAIGDYMVNLKQFQPLPNNHGIIIVSNLPV